MRILRLILIIFLFVFIFISCSKYSKKETEEIISRSEIYSKINRLCTTIPKPNDFDFKFKKFSGNSDLASISFHYSTNKNFNEVKQFYGDWAEKNGWSLSDYEYNMYVKGNQSIIIAPAQSTISDIAILCQESQ